MFETSKKISSGKNIQFGYENTDIFANTLRLDNEVNGLQQVIKTSTNTKQFTNNTDDTLSQMTSSLEQFKVKLLAGANDIHSVGSRTALAQELSSIKDHLVNLANTSVNGKYLFSGTAFSTRPIDANGEYKGNSENINAFLGSNVEQPYNITGEELFLGENGEKQRTITTNIKNFNMSKLHPDLMINNKKDVGSLPEEVLITPEDNIRDLIGDDDNDDTPENYYFYLRGTASDGESFKQRIDVTDDDHVSSLMEKIEQAFGNTPADRKVEVTMNNDGQFVIRDLKQGHSQLQFHMVGSNTQVTDIDTLANTQDAQIKQFMHSGYQNTTPNLNSIKSSKDMFIEGLTHLPITLFNSETDELAVTSTPLDKVFPNMATAITIDVNSSGSPIMVNGTNTVQDLLNLIKTNATNPSEVSVKLLDGKIIIEDSDPSTVENFTLTSANGNAFSSDVGSIYDRKQFTKDGTYLTSNVPQILPSDNSKATPKTLLKDVASGSTLAGSSFNFEGKTIQGNMYAVTIELRSTASGGSRFGVDTDFDGTVDDYYDILKEETGTTGVATDADEMTYQQLMDVMNMVLTEQLPVDADAPADGIQIDEYSAAIKSAKENGNVSFDQHSRIRFQDLKSTDTQAEISLYSSTTNSSFSSTVARDSEKMLFHANNALTVEDPKVSLFDDLDAMIEAVRIGRYHPDGDNLRDPRNMGVQVAINKLDQIMEHVSNKHTKIGAIGNAIQFTIERNEILEVNTRKVRSEVLDTDLAATTLQFQQLQLTYQAMLSTVSKVNQLSLVKYL
jgi:flagellar hook-associated protein 3 FlgL